MDQDNYDIQEMLDDYAQHVPDKEVKIINAAINAFSEKGFKYTKTREIAHRAGVAEGTIFRYFKNKDAILEKMVPLLIRILQPRLEEPILTIIRENENAGIASVMKAILNDRIRIVRDNGPFIRSVVPELFHRPKLMAQVERALLPMIEKYMAQILQIAYRRGEIREGIRPDIVTIQMLGFVLTYTAMCDVADEQRVRADVSDYIKTVMEGWGNHEHD